jgi:hypothetical protein
MVLKDAFGIYSDDELEKCTLAFLVERKRVLPNSGRGCK